MKPSTYLPSNIAAGSPGTSHERQSSPDTATARTMTVPAGTSAIMLAAETTNARVTFDGTDPSAASAPSLVVIKDQPPIFVPVGAGTVLKFCSTAAAASVLQALYLN